MKASFLLFMILCLLGIIIRTSYELLKTNGKINPRNKIVFGVVFIGMMMLLSSWFFMGLSDPWHFELPLFFHWFGLAIILSGLLMAVGGLIQLRGLENIEHLETKGLYGKIRHPMYTGFILWIIGWILFFGSGASSLIGVVAILNILFWRHLEEQKLSADYGDEYKKYRSATWI